MEVKTVIEAIIIIIVVAFLIFIPSKGYTAVKYILNYGNEEVIEDTPESVSTEFQNIVSDFGTCFNSDDNNCICDVNILRFPPGYTISFFGQNIMEITNPNRKMIIKNQRKIFEKRKVVNCYVKFDNTLKIESISDPSYLDLDKSDRNVLIKKPKSSWSWSNFEHSFKDQGELKDYYDYPFLDQNKMFYKQGDNICFILQDELSSEGQAYVNKLLQCSPKPLNSKL